MQGFLLTFFRGPMMALFGALLNVAAAKAKTEAAKKIKDPALRDATNQAVDGFMLEVINAASEAGKN